MQSIVVLKSSQSLFFDALAFGPQCSQNAVKQNLHKGKFFVVCVWEGGGRGGGGGGLGFAWASGFSGSAPARF